MYGSGWEMQATSLEQRRGWGFCIFSVGQQSLLAKQGCKALILGQREYTRGKEQISDTGPSIPWDFPSPVPTFTLLFNAGLNVADNCIDHIALPAWKPLHFFSHGCNILFVNLVSSWVHHEESCLSLFSLREAGCSVCLWRALSLLKLGLEFFILRIIVSLAAFVLF